MNKLARRWLAAKELRVAVEETVELDVEVSLFGVGVGGIDGVVDEVAVELTLFEARDVMGGIVVGVGLSEAGRVVVSLSVVNLSEVSVRRLLTLYE